jgi:hypothetical protein
VPRDLLRRRAIGLPIPAPADTQHEVRRTVSATLDKDPLNAPSGCIDHGHVPTVAVRRSLRAGKGASREPAPPCRVCSGRRKQPRQLLSVRRALLERSGPVLDAMLPDGSRLHVAIPDISGQHWSVKRAQVRGPGLGRGYSDRCSLLVRWKAASALSSASGSVWRYFWVVWIWV